MENSLDWFHVTLLQGPPNTEGQLVETWERCQPGRLPLTLLKQLFLNLFLFMVDFIHRMPRLLAVFTD